MTNTEPVPLGQIEEVERQKLDVAINARSVIDLLGKLDEAGKLDSDVHVKKLSGGGKVFTIRSGGFELGILTGEQEAEEKLKIIQFGRPDDKLLLAIHFDENEEPAKDDKGQVLVETFNTDTLLPDKLPSEGFLAEKGKELAAFTTSINRPTYSEGRRKVLTAIGGLALAVIACGRMPAPTPQTTENQAVGSSPLPQETAIPPQNQAPPEATADPRIEKVREIIRRLNDPNFYAEIVDGKSVVAGQLDPAEYDNITDPNVDRQTLMNNACGPSSLETALRICQKLKDGSLPPTKIGDLINRFLYLKYQYNGEEFSYILPERSYTMRHRALLEMFSMVGQETNLFRTVQLPSVPVKNHENDDSHIPDDFRPAVVKEANEAVFSKGGFLVVFGYKHGYGHFNLCTSMEEAVGETPEVDNFLDPRGTNSPPWYTFEARRPEEFFEDFTGESGTVYPHLFISAFGVIPTASEA